LLTGPSSSRQAVEDPPLQAFCADLKHRRSFTGR